MDTPTAADEEIKKRLFEENQRLVMENKDYREKNAKLCLLTFDRSMELMVTLLKAKPESTEEEVLSSLAKDYADWLKGPAIEYGALVEQAAVLGQIVFNLTCRLCWEYIQIYHPEKEDCQLVAVFRQNVAYPDIVFVPKATPKE